MADTATKGAQNRMGTEGKQELVQSYSALSEYLKKLETENKKLAQDLERKKREREERQTARVKDSARSQERLDSMARHIHQADDVARRQREFLDEMLQFFAENEARLASIGKRIASVSAAPGEPAPATVSDLKSDLVNILNELKEMRQRREQLMKEA